MSETLEQRALRIWFEAQADHGSSDSLPVRFARRLLAEQGEPIGETRENGAVWFGQNPHAFPVGTLFYATSPTQDELDAKRYRWIKGRAYKDGDTLSLEVAVIDDIAIGDFGEFIDAAIDAAMNKEPK